MGPESGTGVSRGGFRCFLGLAVVAGESLSDICGFEFSPGVMQVPFTNLDTDFSPCGAVGVWGSSCTLKSCSEVLSWLLDVAVFR